MVCDIMYNKKMIKTYNEKLINLINNYNTLQIPKQLKLNGMMELLESETNFIIKNHKITYKERLWYVKNNIHETVCCPTCGKSTKYDIHKKKISFCSISCSLNQVTPSGLKLKDVLTNNRMKINPETGLTKAKEIGLKAKETKSKINPKSGLTKYQEIGKKSSKTLNRKIKETGLSKAKERGLKTKETNSKINPKSGLTKYQEINIKANKTKKDNGVEYQEKIISKIKESLSKVDIETGLSKAKERGLKTKETNSKINPKSGLTKYQEIGLKAKETNSKINPASGLTKYQEIGLKAKETNSKINKRNGLTKYQEIGLKIKETLSKINPKSGLTRAQEISLKAKETLSKINPETGLTKYQEIAEKNKKQRRVIGYDIIKHNLNNEYTLLTLKEEYINQSSRLIKYQHSCGEIRESYWPYVRCLECYPYNKSIAENEILEYCKTFTNNVISNDRQLIKPLELDIVLPDFKLAIEYDGLFWHSSYSIETESPDYHLMKTQQCMEHGYQLLHIFENEWEDSTKKDIWESIISNRLGQSERIYARKCEIRNVDSESVKNFLNSNHLQGYVPSSINIGLFYNNELVSLMTFGKSRYNKEYDWELLRFCNKKYITVIGGASRLFKYFTKSNDGIVISYADMRRSNGNLYDVLGFELSHISNPNYWYWNKKNGLVLESRIKYQKYKLISILAEYDANLTESENMYNNDYRKIYDCGNQVWICDVIPKK